MGSDDLFHNFSTNIFLKFISQNTFALTFLTHIILAIGGVSPLHTIYNLLYFTLCLELIIVPKGFYQMHFEIPVMYTTENANKKLNLRLYT